MKNIKREVLCVGLSLGLPVLFELLYHVFVLGSGFGTVYMILYAVLTGSALYALLCFLPSLAAKILYCVGNSMTLLYFMVQIVYYEVFGVPFSFHSLFAVGGDALEFKDTIFHAVAAKLWLLFVYLVIALIACIIFCRNCRTEKMTWKQRLITVGCFGAGILLFYGVLYLGGTQETSAYDLYTRNWNETLGAERLGILVYAKKDIWSLLKGQDMSGELDDVVIINRPSIQTPQPTEAPITATPTPEPSLIPLETATPSPTASVTPLPTPTPIDTSPNVLQIDFNALAAAETNKEVKKLHEYFANEEYTLKNEYTGLFQGYNLIFITAEGFAPYAMQEGLTPTLLKMANEGFVFQNYYCPIWNTSTIDGEFANTTGLLPDGLYSWRRTIGHDMRFSLGKLLGETGYQTRAYHNHSYTYYDRDEIYPNMGYVYKGRGNGLNVKKQWPGSDLEMMELSVPEYIGESPFHVYYMTVSGHLEYNFGGNRMASKNKEVVENLPYSDNAKAYVACNYELEQAMTSLLEQLENAGVADRTVIVLAPDHYPYGLDKEDIDELSGHEVEETFELYKSTLIIWSPSMETPVQVEKYCSSIDIAPTIANLFGLDYDSRLYMGKDILSSAEGLVMFKEKSFITDKVMYNAFNGAVTYLTEEEISEDYVSMVKQIVKNRFKISKGIIDLDYYSYLP